MSTRASLGIIEDALVDSDTNDRTYRTLLKVRTELIQDEHLDLDPGLDTDWSMYPDA